MNSEASEKQPFGNIPPEIVLVGVTALWGSSFLMLSISLGSMPPGLLVASRFGFGALLLACILQKKLFTLTLIDWIAGFWTGSAIFVAYGLQTYGLQTIPSSVSGFLTALYVPFVPLLQWAIFRKFPGTIVCMGIAVAFAGMMLLCDPFSMKLSNSLGEWITVVSAFACAVEILVISYFAKRCRPAAFCFTQLVIVTVWALGYSSVMESWQVHWNPSLIFCLAMLIGILVFNQYAISWAQKSVTPTRAVLIYTLEPVFAGIIGWLAGERLGWMALFGGTLVILSVLVSSWLPGVLQRKNMI